MFTSLNASQQSAQMIRFGFQAANKCFENLLFFFSQLVNFAKANENQLHDELPHWIQNMVHHPGEVCELLGHSY